MFITTVIICFILGIVFTLCVQYVVVRVWFCHQPVLCPPYKQQYGKFQLPKVFVDSLNYLAKKTASKDTGTKPDSGVNVPPNDKSDSNIILNVIIQFLFAELKDTAVIRRWAARKLNVEFEEMLASKTGKFVNQIEVRDFNLGTYFPVIQSLELKNVELSQDADFIQTFDLMFDIIYEGDFQLTLDINVIFGAWAYLSIIVRKLYGRARVQFSRVPYTHWSFAFYEEPRLELDVDSRFNGRPIPQIASLIISQIKRIIRKKHVLPAYKLRSKPLFTKPEEAFINPDIYFHGNQLVRGKLSVKVLRCGRLLDLYKDSKLFCTLSVDREKIEEVWRQSWLLFEVHLKIPSNTPHGLSLRDQLSGEKMEKRRVIVEGVVPDSPAGQADLRRGDIIEFISNTRVLSFKHAMKQLRNAENVTLRIMRYRRKCSNLEDGTVDESQPFIYDMDEKETDNEVKEEFEALFNIYHKDKKTDFNQPLSKLNEASTPEKIVPTKSSERFSKKIYSGKKQMLGNKEPPVEDVVSPPEDQTLLEFDDDTSITQPAVVGISSDTSHSAKSSPQKHARDLKGQRMHNDSGLYKATEVDNTSLGSDHGYQAQELRAGEVSTREIPFSENPEWNEDFEFVCNDDDKFVNVCVWCRMIQPDTRSSKQPPLVSKVDSQSKNVASLDDFPKYNLTTKIGYISIPLADIAAGCLLTLQGDTQYTMYLHPPEESISASRTKVPFTHVTGFDKNICHGDITLSFVHVPLTVIGKMERKKIIDDALNLHPVVSGKGIEKNKFIDGLHSFKPSQFPSGTYCKFCGKKIWLKAASQCEMCKMVCHKKCVDKCQIQTQCSKDGPRMASQPNEPWVVPMRDDREEIEAKPSISLMNLSKFKSRDHLANPVNIPKAVYNTSPSVSPCQSPSRQTLTEMRDRHLAVADMHRTHSDKSLRGMVDSDSDITKKYRQPNYSLDDTTVIEAKEKGKELHANLSLPERKKTIDDMITKLKDAIDKESDCKSELMKTLEKSTDPDHRHVITNQLDKCDVKIEALMMMMVHYCAGLQNCQDQEDTNKRNAMALSGAAQDPEILDVQKVQGVVITADGHGINIAF